MLIFYAFTLLFKLLWNLGSSKHTFTGLEFVDQRCGGHRRRHQQEYDRPRPQFHGYWRRTYGQGVEDGFDAHTQVALDL